LRKEKPEDCGASGGAEANIDRPLAADSEVSKITDSAHTIGLPPASAPQAGQSSVQNTKPPIAVAGARLMERCDLVFSEQSSRKTMVASVLAFRLGGPLVARTVGFLDHACCFPLSG